MVTATRPVIRSIFPGLVLGALALLVMVILGNFNQIGIHIFSFQWQFFVLAFLFDFINHFLRFLKTSYHFNQSGVKGLSFWHRIKLFLSGAPLSATPIRVSESYKSVWLSQASGIPLHAADSLHLIDRTSDTLSVLVLATAGTLAFPSFWPFFLLICVLFLAATLSLQIKPAGIKLFDAGDSIPNLRSFSQQLRKCVDGNPRAFSFIPMSIAFSLGVFSWLAQGVALFFILVGLGLMPNLVLIAISCLVLAFSMLMGLISRLPGGLGVIELAMAALLTILLNFRPELAVSATILFRLATFWIDMLFGILFWSVTQKSQLHRPGAGRIV